ncbi:MAG: hypothetical protein RSE13_20620 [Planktothrix sp. GU0601_MAG3]|nr:MAG: hypothetical protein RSE13_20620 [Planktothrix sp. GU0601_MAG3]
MSQSYPPNPRSNLPLDEIIAIIVALATIGTILYWVLSQPNRKLVLNPDLTSPITLTPSTNPSVAKIPEDSLPDGVSPTSETPTPGITTPSSPTPKVKQSQSAILGLAFLIPAQKPIQPSLESQVIPVLPSSENTTPTKTKTACSVSTHDGKYLYRPFTFCARPIFHNDRIPLGYSIYPVFC